ncbi:anti-sigma factor RsbA family regulatory protein [Allokutzneria oryzae]|uniref:Anti-sigma factor RsbA family regulatory protein n=1 Tax=Allokutzneria oryzae TaxID=1378989 RepID=A0ABV6A8W6_9PSEU
MSHQQATAAGAAFVHQACFYGSNDEFLAMAVPFVEDGLARNEPVLAAVTAANIDVLNEALGSCADDVEYADTAYFGRRPPQRVASFDRYWKRRSTPAAEHVRILAEPVWFGRSRQEVVEWKRLESGLNSILAATNIWMICPYDTRVVDPAIIADARRTHPAHVQGHAAHTCPEFVEPQEFAARCDADPLPPPPARAAALPFTGDLRSVREFATTQADVLGLTGGAISLWTVAVGEIAGYVASHGSGRAAVRVWAHRGNLVCEVHDPGGRLPDRFLGYRPPAVEPEPGDELWFPFQVCEHVDIRSGAAGYTVRLHFPGPRSEQTLLAAIGSPG